MYSGEAGGGGFLEEEDLGLKSENVQEETRHRGAGTSQRNGIFTFKKSPRKYMDMPSGSLGSGSRGHGIFCLYSLCFPSSTHKPQVSFESGGVCEGGHSQGEWHGQQQGPLSSHCSWPRAGCELWS